MEPRHEGGLLSTQPRTDYANPPIEEALCQLNFSTPLPWNVATPGRLYDALLGSYPDEPEVQEEVQASVVRPDEGSPALAANLAIARGAQRFVYRDASRTRVAVVSPMLYSVNSLRPYEGWSDLRQRLRRDLQQVARQLDLPNVREVSLRYINRIPITADNIDTDDYFTIPIRTAQRGRASVARFLQRVESVLPDQETRTFLTFASLDSAPEAGRACLLDIELRRGVPDVPVATALDVADDLKRLENEEFESLITERCRELFQ